MPDDKLEQFFDIVKDTKADDKILDTAGEAYKSQLKAVERFAGDLGQTFGRGVKHIFNSESDLKTRDVKVSPTLIPTTTQEKGNYLFNDIGCDFRGTHVKLDTPLSKKTDLYTDIGPRKQSLGIEYKSGSSTVSTGVEHKKDVYAVFANYEYNTGVGKFSLEGKASKDVNGISASYRENGFKINGSVWEGNGYQINFEKNLNVKKSEITLGGAINNDCGFIYGRIVL